MILVFQCVLDIRHNGGRSIGKICSRFSSINCTTYSLDHKANDRSATYKRNQEINIRINQFTWKCGDVADRDICLKSDVQTNLNICESIISRISSSSFRNKIYEEEEENRKCLDDEYDNYFFCWACFRPKFQ